MGHGEGHHQGNSQRELPPPAPEPHAQSWGPRTHKVAHEHVCPLGRLRCKGIEKTSRSYSRADGLFLTCAPARSPESVRRGRRPLSSSPYPPDAFTTAVQSLTAFLQHGCAVCAGPRHTPPCSPCDSAPHPAGGVVGYL